jgi:type VI secretion system secreted protein VgrG
MSESTPSAAQTQQPFLSLTAPLKGMTPISFWAEETISKPFLVTIEALADQPDLDPTVFLYHPVCLTLADKSGPKRYFHGIVRRFVAGEGRFRDYWAYSMEVVPQLWFMSQTADSRIFQQQSSDQIITTLLQDAGVSPVQWLIYGDKPVHDYTVQMNETDLDFVTRLMQQEGWFYFFQHTQSAHTLMITDANTGFKTIQEPQVALGTSERLDALRSWSPFQATAYGRTILKDYDPTTPTKPLEATQNTTEGVAGAARRDFFRWPALSYVPNHVDQRTRIIQEAAEANASLIAGMGQHDGFIPGGKFVLKEDPYTGAANQEHVIRSVVHQGSENTIAAGGWSATYGNSFTCFPSGNTWREQLTVPRPRMYGIYSAVVIGPDGEEIYTDKYGRVKVLFPWDRRKDSTPGGSVWLRVVQPWTGQNWGWQFIPRVGTEVAVAFMDGDIDRPVVVGGLYNGDYMPPFVLPDEKTKSGLRTRSTLKGNTANFSEFSIDDKKGQELVFLHAEKDHTVEVENDQKVTIGGNQTIKIGSDDPSSGGGDQTVEIAKDRDVTIDRGNDSLLLKQGDLSTKLSMGNMSIELSMGNLSTKASLGQISEDAMQSITMTVGENSIKIDQTGITISGLMVKVQGQVMAQTEAPIVQVSGDGMLTLKGGIVMIN